MHMLIAELMSATVEALQEVSTLQGLVEGAWHTLMFAWR